MTVRAIILWFLLLSMIAAQGLYAAENRGLSTGQSSLETVQQKLHLVKMLLAKSPALERAARSDDITVMRQTAMARTLYADANDTLSAVNTAHADELLDEAPAVDRKRHAPSARTGCRRKENSGDATPSYRRVCTTSWPPIMTCVCACRRKRPAHPNQNASPA